VVDLRDDPRLLKNKVDILVSDIINIVATISDGAFRGVLMAYNTFDHLLLEEIIKDLMVTMVFYIL
jgi:hypothetical protein